MFFIMSVLMIIKAMVNKGDAIIVIRKWDLHLMKHEMENEIKWT